METPGERSGRKDQQRTHDEVVLPKRKGEWSRQNENKKTYPKIRRRSIHSTARKFFNNKAGYTAISRVQLGRGSNAQKSTKKLREKKGYRPINV